MPFSGQPRTADAHPSYRVWSKAEVKAYAKAYWKLPKRQWKCLYDLNMAESKWDYRARGSRTRLGRAYGIAQALPASKMSNVGLDFKFNPVTQIVWQKKYIDSRYSGNPCYAWKHEQRKGWY